MMSGCMDVPGWGREAKTKGETERWTVGLVVVR